MVQAAIHDSRRCRKSSSNETPWHISSPSRRTEPTMPNRGRTRVRRRQSKQAGDLLDDGERQAVRDILDGQYSLISRPATQPQLKQLQRR